MFALEAAITSIPFQKFKVSGAAIDTAMIDVASFLFFSLSLSHSLFAAHILTQVNLWKGSMKYEMEKKKNATAFYFVYHFSSVLLSLCKRSGSVRKALSLYALFIHGRIHFI